MPETRNQRMTLLILFTSMMISVVNSIQPNFIMIMADDLDFDYKQDRLQVMPNLLAVRESGAQFLNHVAAHPVCGPSRSSYLAGRYPHNTGYKYNAQPSSIKAWAAQQNNTLGTWLTTAGYYTAYHGKYINGMEEDVPSGWRHWGGFSSGVGTYNYFNSTPYNVSGSPSGEPQRPFISTPMTGVHQADFLGQRAKDSIQAALAEGRPFYIQVNPVMVHWGTCYGPCPKGDCYAANDPHWEYSLPATPEECSPARNGQPCALPIDPCPTLRHANAYNDLTNPHVQSWNESAVGGVPYFVNQIPPLTDFESRRQNMGFRNRTASAADLDDMIGVITAAINAAGVADNTYLIFTSDNGYHLGEHKFIFGKGQPYDTDIRLPFYIRGPQIPANSTLLYPTNHLDLTATIVELSGAKPVGPPLDGLSFASALSLEPISANVWRNFSYSEYFGGVDTWIAMRYPNGGLPAASQPLDGGLKLHFWCTNEIEVFNITSDSWELENLHETQRGSALKNATLGTLNTLSSCSGMSCYRPNSTIIPANGSIVSCYNVTQRVFDMFDP
jgi:N-acetylglucosamine-6-sulfatase